MKSPKFTMDDVKNKEDTWKTVISLNEIALLTQLQNLNLAYSQAEHNAWIVKTLVDKKQRYKFKTCKSIVLVGSGIYPYSMFDLHKQSDLYTLRYSWYFFAVVQFS